MRINKFIAQATGISRRKADQAVEQGRVKINGKTATMGIDIASDDKVTIDGRTITPSVKPLTVMLNKPAGYVCSRNGQGSKTVYDLLPPELHHLKPAGRLDKDSSGLLLLTNDGELANKLTHPSFHKSKVYEVEIDHPLTREDLNKITKTGVDIGDRVLSRFQLELRIKNYKSRQPVGDSSLISSPLYIATLSEGRNRQIRRTFEALGYKVTRLHRTQFGPYNLAGLKPADFIRIEGYSPLPASTQKQLQ